MSALIVHRLSEIPAYEGPHALPGIRFRGVRAALGVQAWGMNVLELDAHCTAHPAHDHGADGQEEVYLVLAGRVVLLADDERLDLAEGDIVRVAPARVRQLVTEEESAVILALGGSPGQPYAAGPGM